MRHLKFVAMVGLLILSSAVGIALAQPGGGYVHRDSKCENFVCASEYSHPGFQEICVFTSGNSADICKGGVITCTENGLTLICVGVTKDTRVYCDFPFIRC